MINIIITKLHATAEPNGQLRDCKNKSTKALPTKNTLPPPRNAGIKNSPISKINTSMQPVAIPGIDNGIIILIKFLKFDAPKSLDASRIFYLIFLD